MSWTHAGHQTAAILCMKSRRRKKITFKGYKVSQWKCADGFGTCSRKYNGQCAQHKWNVVVEGSSAELFNQYPRRQWAKQSNSDVKWQGLSQKPSYHFPHCHSHTHKHTHPTFQPASLGNQVHSYCCLVSEKMDWLIHFCGVLNSPPPCSSSWHLIRLLISQNLSYLASRMLWH